MNIYIILISPKSLNVSYISSWDHVLGDIGDSILISIHVWPSGILGGLVYDVLVLMRIHHLLTFISQIHFVVQEMLIICEVLDCPLILFRVLVFNSFLVVVYLASSLIVNPINLSRSESFKVIRNIPMWRKLRSSRFEVFGHDVGHVCSGDLTLILLFLIVSPRVISIFLLLG
jgi:hypothetical protein